MIKLSTNYNINIRILRILVNSYYLSFSILNNLTKLDVNNSKNKKFYWKMILNE